MVQVFTDYNTLRYEHFDHLPGRPIVLHRVQLASGKGVYARLKI
jgi:hypothetical protein